MPIKSRAELEERFQNGDIPDQNDFIDVFDSYIHQTEDGVTAYTAPDSTQRFGIGITTPDSRLGIKELPGGRFLSFHKTDNTAVWDINRITSPVNAGLSLSELTPGGELSRLFLQEGNGRVGIGTTLPENILHLVETNGDAATTMRISNNAAAGEHPGWEIGHVHNAAVTEKNGAFSFFESPLPAGDPLERMTILPGGFVGINETLPDTFLHVGGDPLDINTPIGLQVNTGLVEVGPITSSVLLDYRGIQSRKGIYDPSLTLSVDTLHLQNLGGELLIHGKTSTPEVEKVIVALNGNTGIGKLIPQAKLHVNGRIIVGDTSGEPDVAGAMRWFNGDFEGFNGSNWVSLTSGTGYWSPAGTDMIRYNPANAKVGIGVASPDSALDIAHGFTEPMGVMGCCINVTGNTSGSSLMDMRVGLELSCTGVFSTVTAAKNIGLHIPEVTGQDAEANIAAVLNGNTVIGQVVQDANMVGDDGNRVLVIQKGTAPATAVPGPGGAASTAIQIYADSDATGKTFFKVMDNQGFVISLFKQTPLPDRNENPVGSNYTGNEQEIITNLRSRLDALESKLVALGLFDSSGILP
jgi:hypothetical protein